MRRKEDKAATVMLSSPLWNGSAIYTRIPEGASEEAVEKVLKFFEDLVNEEPRLFKVSFLDKDGNTLAIWRKPAE